MSEMTLNDIAARMRQIDFTMLTTRTDGGALATRPMSNNGEVDFDGDCWFFSYEETRTVSDIMAEPAVGLSLQGTAGLLGAPPLFVAISGTAEILRDRSTFERHWVEGLERWFPDGVDTAGMVLIRVHAERVHYWNAEDEGEVRL